MPGVASELKLKVFSLTKSSVKSVVTWFAAASSSKQEGWEDEQGGGHRLERTCSQLMIGLRAAHTPAVSEDPAGFSSSDYPMFSSQL